MRVSSFQTSRDPMPLQQSPAYARTLRSLGRHTQMIDNYGVGCMLVIGRQTPFGPLQMVTRGPIWETDDAAQQIDFLRQNKVHILSAENSASDVLRRAGFWQAITPTSTALLNLDVDLHAACHPKWRNAWRKSLKMGLNVGRAPFDQNRDHWIMDVEQAQQKVAGYRSYPRAFTVEFARLNPDAVITYTAYCGTVPVAAMIFLKHWPTITYHLGWSGPQGRQCNAHNMLLYQAACDFSCDGYSHLDLGQIDTVRAPGLARFKLGTGAAVHTLSGTWLRRPGW